MLLRNAGHSRVILRRGATVAIAFGVLSCVDQDPLSRSGYAAVNPPRSDVLSCTASAPGPSSCPDISLTFSTYSPGSPFGQFQSDAGTGASNPITITFSKPISSVTVTAQDPTFAGNELQAFNAGGAQIGSAPIAGNGTPGTNVPQTVTITAPGITSITLVPAPADYVAYSGLSFTATDTCTIFRNPGDVTDPLLNDPAVQAVLRDLAEQTHWNLPLSQQTEVGGFLGRNNTTGAIQFFPYEQVLTGIPPGPCLSGTLQSQITVDIPAAGFTVVGQVHTHPKVSFSAADPGNCYNWDRRTQSVVPRRPDNFNRLDFRPGPSDADMEPWRNNGTAPAYPGYVIGPGVLDRWERSGGRLRRDRTLRTNSCVAMGG